MKRVYVHPALTVWLTVLKQVTDKCTWVTEIPESSGADDIIILPQAELARAVSEGPGKWFYVTDELNGPQLAEILDVLEPKTEELDEEVLEQGWRKLLRDADSFQDLDRLARFGHVLWQKRRREADRSWLRLAEMAWTFEFRKISTPDGELPLYRAIGYSSWYEFTNEYLEIAAPVSSSLKWTWEVFHIRLGWPIERMVEIGRSKLSLANSRVKTLMDDPEQQDGEKLEQLLKSLSSDSFGAIQDRLKADRDGGSSISFALEPVEDWEMVRSWLDERVKPDILHAKIWLDGAPIEDGLTIILHPGIDPESAALIRKKLSSLLHWGHPVVTDR